MPSSTDLKRVARRVLVQPDLAGASEHQARLEGALLERFGARVPSASTRVPRWRRFALGGLVSVAALAAACRIPTEYELDVGHRIAIEIPLDTAALVGPEVLAQFVEHNYTVDAIDVSARVEVARPPPAGWAPGDAGAEGTMVVELDIVGEDLDTEAVWREMLVAYPVLEGARIDAESIEASVRGTWGGRLSHAWLDVVIDEHGVEEAKRQLREDLEAQGLEPVSAEITVSESDDANGHRRRVEVRVEAKADPVPTDPG